MSWKVRSGGAWRDVTQPGVLVGGVWKPVVRAMMYDAVTSQWRRVWPETELTTTAITGGLTGTVPVGVPRTVTGTVSTVAGIVSGGTVTVYQRPVGATSWQSVGTATVGTGAVAPWSAAVTPLRCGATEFKASYGGTPTSQPSESAIQAVAVSVNAPAKPTGVSIANTTASISWPAVPGADGYDVFRGATKVADKQTALTFTDTLLTPATAYSWTVVAHSEACVSAASPAKTGTTGQNAVTDTGSATIQIRPDKTNSYRTDVKWGYIGANVGQGYYTNSSSNYTGVMDYGTNDRLRTECEKALGANGAARYANMTVSAARVYLYKVAGVGSGGSVTVDIYNSPAIAGSGGLPVRNGTASSESSASGGAGKWHAVAAEHWNALKAGTARSLILYKATAAAYARFDGKDVGANRCDLSLDCSWNYQLTVAVPPAWTN